MTTEIFEVCSRDCGGLYFIPHNLSYFSDHFVCEPMATVWSPPPLKVVRKWKRPADFSFWMLRAPIVRERVVHLLSAFCGDDLEFLPFYITERGEELFAMNVLTTDATRPVFKQDRKSIVYARRQFGELARDKKFTGLALADPDADNIRLTIRGRDVNAFPGLGT